MPPPRRHVERVSAALLELWGNDSSIFRACQLEILDWLAGKAGQPLPDAMMQGATATLDPEHAQRVETVACDDPPFWAARQEDQAETGSFWVTEVILRRTQSPHAVTLGCRLSRITRGEPTPFQRSIPRLVRRAATGRQAILDGNITQELATPIAGAEQLDDLVALIEDPHRLVPVIGVSLDPSHHALLDVDALARDVFGCAHVRLLSRDASFMLTDRIGKPFSVYNGAVRLWETPLDASADNPFDHPLWLAGRLLAEGPDPVRRMITERVLRLATIRRDLDDAIPPFARSRLAAEAVAAPTHPTSNGEELARLNLLLQETRETYDGLLELAEQERDRAITERDEASREIRALRERLTEVSRTVRAREQRGYINIPEDLEGLEEWAERHLTGSVRLLPRALRAARKSDFEDTRLVYDVLLALKEDYVPMRLGVPGARERWDDQLQRLKLTISPTHGGDRAGENPSDYLVDYDGRRRELDLHLRGRNSRETRYGFRLYFFWCDRANQVIVGSLPSHLPTRLS